MSSLGSFFGSPYADVDPKTINQDGATIGQGIVWNGTDFVPATMPGTELDYAQITASVSGIAATTEATATAVITGNSITYDGTRVKVEAFAVGVSPNAAGILITAVLFRDTTPIGQEKIWGAVSGTEYLLTMKTFDVPAAGAHIYALKMFVASSTANIGAGAGISGAKLPAHLRVTKA